MDAIADKTFKTEAHNLQHSNDSPSLLTVIIDTNPLIWSQVQEQPEATGDSTLSFTSMLESLTVGINAHLALNNANEVAVIANHHTGAHFLYPVKKKEQVEKTNGEHKFVQKEMYRQFRMIDESFLSSAFELFQTSGDDEQSIKPPKNSLSASLSLALTYINKRQHTSTTSIKTRILIVNVTQDTHLKYIPIMNSIFAAQKLHIPIDVAQLSTTQDSTFLQQASDATNGVYLKIETTKTALIQYLTTVFFLDPSIRPIVIAPSNGDIDFRASCYLTGKIVDMGFVCSVCLCILSLIPNDRKCPACESEFEANVVKKLLKKPVVVGNKKIGVKKRKLDGSSSSANVTPGAGNTPLASPSPAP